MLINSKLNMPGAAGAYQVDPGRKARRNQTSAVRLLIIGDIVWLK